MDKVILALLASGLLLHGAYFAPRVVMGHGMSQSMCQMAGLEGPKYTDFRRLKCWSEGQWAAWRAKHDAVDELKLINTLCYRLSELVKRPDCPVFVRKLMAVSALDTASIVDAIDNQIELDESQEVQDPNDPVVYQVEPDDPVSKVISDICAADMAVQPDLPQVGSQVIYQRTGEVARLLAVHRDAEGQYATLEMSKGQERQVELDSITWRQVDHGTFEPLVSQSKGVRLMAPYGHSASDSPADVDSDGSDDSFDWAWQVCHCPNDCMVSLSAEDLAMGHTNCPACRNGCRCPCTDCVAQAASIEFQDCIEPVWDC